MNRFNNNIIKKLKTIFWNDLSVTSTENLMLNVRWNKFKYFQFDLSVCFVQYNTIANHHHTIVCISYHSLIRLCLLFVNACVLEFGPVCTRRQTYFFVLSAPSVREIFENYSHFVGITYQNNWFFLQIEFISKLSFVK